MNVFMVLFHSGHRGRLDAWAANFRNSHGDGRAPALQQTVLWQRRSGFRFYQRRVNRIDKSVDVHILAEVGVGHRITGL